MNISLIKNRMKSKIEKMNISKKQVYMFSAITLMFSIACSTQTKISRSVSTVCQESLATVDKVDIVCMSGCDDIQTDLVVFNSTCYKLAEGVNIVNCCGNKITTIKPSSDNHCYNTLPHSWCDMLLIIKKLLFFFSTSFTLYLFKSPVLHLFKLIDILFGFILKKNKKCITCLRSYRFYHNECNIPIIKKFDYNLIYYVIVFFILASISMVGADDSLFNTYDHGDYTEFIIKDVDRHVSEFYNKQNHIRITIDKSYLNIELQHNHVLVEKVADIVKEIRHSCDSEADCINGLKDKSTARSIKKSHDGFACLFSDAYVCMSCGISSKMFADVYTMMTSRPTIIANMQINDGEKYTITIDSYDDYIDENFYIRYINPSEFTHNTFLVKDDKVYIGNICLAPSSSCFGSHIVKDGLPAFNYDPVIVDDGHWSKSARLVRCTNNENLDLNQLQYIGTFDQNTNSVHVDKSFGHFSVGVRNKMLLNDDKCESEVIVKDISSSGCYNCKYGFTADVKFQYKGKKCGVINCKTETYKSKTYVNDDYNELAVLHMFTDKETGVIICNSVSVNYKLDNSLISSHYTKSYSSTSSQVEMFSDVGKLIDHLSLDIKKKLFFTILILLTFYFTFKHVTNTFQHGRKAINILRKKDDDYTLVQHNFPN